MYEDIIHYTKIKKEDIPVLGSCIIIYTENIGVSRYLCKLTS